MICKSRQTGELEATAIKLARFLITAPANTKLDLAFATPEYAAKVMKRVSQLLSL